MEAHNHMISVQHTQISQYHENKMVKNASSGMQKGTIQSTSTIHQYNSIINTPQLTSHQINNKKRKVEGPTDLLQTSN